MKKLLSVIIFFIFSTLVYGQNDYFLAEDYYRNGEYEKASTLFKKLVNKSPYNTTYIQRLTYCYQELNKFDLVETTIRNLQKRHRNLDFLNVVIGYNYEKQQKHEKANAIYNEVINSLTNKRVNGVIVANLFQKYNKLTYALKAYEKILAQNPKSNFGFQMAQIYGELGNFKKMFDSYIDMLDKNANFLKLVKRYAAKYVTDDSENENNILFKKALLRKSVSNPKEEWNNLLSWLFIKQKEYNKALIQEKALYARNPDNLSGIKELAKIAFKEKAYEVSKKANDFVIQKTNYPDDKMRAVLTNIKIGVATKQPNQEQEFERVLNELGLNKNTIHIQTYYANYLLNQQKNAVKAQEILEKALTLTNDKYDIGTIKFELANVAVFKERFNKALILYSQIQNSFKNHPFGQYAQYRVAQTSYFKGDFKWAMAQLKVLKGSVSQLTANDAADLYVTISDNFPKDSLATGLKKVAKADLLTSQNNYDSAIILLDEVIKNYKGQNIEDDALYKQAKLFIKNKKYTQAILNFEKIVAIGNEGIYLDDAYFNMAELYNNELNDKEKAKQYYQKIIFEFQSSIYLVDARKKYRKLRGDENL